MPLFRALLFMVLAMTLCAGRGADLRAGRDASALQEMRAEAQSSRPNAKMLGQLQWVEKVATKDPFFKPQSNDPLSDLPLDDVILASGARYERCVLIERNGAVVKFQHKTGTAVVLSKLLPSSVKAEFERAQSALKARRVELTQLAAQQVRDEQAKEKARLDALEQERKARPRNSQVLVKTPGAGTGELVISNETFDDAIVSLVSATGAKHFVSIYVRAHEKASLRHIAFDSYRVVFGLGTKFNLRTGFFNNFTKAGRFAKQIDYPPVDVRPKSEHTVWKIALHVVPQGEGKIESLSEADYLTVVR